MEKISIKGINEEILYIVSKKGLPIYIWKNEFAKSFYLSLNTLYGSIDTEFMVDGKKYKVPNGIAHFMEHIKFNIDKDTTANDIFDKLGSDINAFTTFKYTSYLVYGTSKIDENLNNLLDYVYNPYFTKEMIKKEKGIITSEINMGKDQPYSKLYFEFNKALYHKEKFRNLVTGDIDDIKNIDLEDIKLIYDVFYHPKNMFLIVTGNVNPYEIEKIVNDNLDKKDIITYLEPKKVKTKEPKGVYKKDVILESNVEVEKAKIGLKIDRKVFKGIDKVRLNIILSLILSSNFGDTSDFKEEMLQEGLITYLAYNRYVEDEFVVLDITLESKYLDEAIKMVLEKLDNLSMDEIDLKRKVNSAISNMVINYEDVENVNNLLQSYIINYGEIIDNTKEIYESITLKDINQAIEKINTKEKTIVKMVKD